MTLEVIDYGVVTLHEVSRAVAHIVREIGAHAVIAESSGVGFDTEKVMAESGYHVRQTRGASIQTHWIGGLTCRKLRW